MSIDPRAVRVVGRADQDRKLLDDAFARLDRELPDWLSERLRALRSDKWRWLRIPLGVLCIAAAAVWFLPVVGIEFLPIGLLLIAQDVPFLRKPTARSVDWLVDRWIALRAWWQRTIA